MLRFRLRSWLLFVIYAALACRAGMFVWALRTYGPHFGSLLLMRW